MGNITIDGSLADWAPADRIDRPDAVPAGYAVYGRIEANDFAFALQAPTAIGPDTTFWLNTDRNAATGYLYGMARP